MTDRSINLGMVERHTEWLRVECVGGGKGKVLPVAKLIEYFGPDYTLPDLRMRLSAKCIRATPGHPCNICFTNIASAFLRAKAAA